MPWRRGEHWPRQPPLPERRKHLSVGHEHEEHQASRAEKEDEQDRRDEHRWQIDLRRAEARRLVGRVAVVLLMIY